MYKEIPNYGLRAYALFFSRHGLQEEFGQSDLDWIIGQSMKKKVFSLLVNSGWIKKVSPTTYKCVNPRAIFRGLLELTANIVNDFAQADLPAEAASSAQAGKKAKPIKIGGVGFAIPGPLNPKREKVLNSPNIKYLNGKPFKKLMEEKLNCPIKIEHDVHCFLLAESIVGLAKNSRNVLYLTLGTGLGGAWTFGGKIYYGAHGSAGEIGHMILRLSESRNIGGVLDLEDLASNKFFKKFYGKDAKELFDLAKQNNKKAKETFKIMGENLGLGLANLINILDPEIIILGGGIAKANKFFLPFTVKTMKKYITSPLAKKEIKIFVSKLPYAGALGAALLFSSERAKWENDSFPISEPRRKQKHLFSSEPH